MKHLTWKTLLPLGGSLFLLYLAIHYWPSVSSVLFGFFASLSPLFIGFGIAYIINIMMCFFRRHFFPRSKKKWVLRLRTPVALTLSLLSLAAILGVVIGLVLPQLILCIKLLMESLPNVSKSTIAFLERYPLLSDTVLPFIKGLNWQNLFGQMVDLLSNGFSGLVNLVTHLVSGTVTLFVSVIFACYLLISKENLLSQCRRLAKAFLPSVFYEKSRYLLRLMNFSFHRYLVGQCTEAIILGVLCALGMWALRLPYPAMISALIAFTALIPIAGAYIGGAIGAIMILTVSPLKALIFVVFLVILQQLEGNLIYPRVVGSSMGLPGFWVLVAITVGGGLFGIMGMLLGVPFAATIYHVVRDSLRKKEAEMKKAEAEAPSSSEGER